jgi:hypothetical protein
MPIHQFHLSREREAEYRLALPRSEVAGGGGVVVELSWLSTGVQSYQLQL